MFLVLAMNLPYVKLLVEYNGAEKAELNPTPQNNQVVLLSAFPEASNHRSNHFGRRRWGNNDQFQKDPHEERKQIVKIHKNSFMVVGRQRETQG